MPGARKDTCTYPPGCGYLKEIVHVGQRGRKEIKLCKECFDLLSRGGSGTDALMSPEPSDAASRSLSRGDRIPEPPATPREQYDRQLARTFFLGIFIGGTTVASVSFVIARLVCG